MTKRKIIFNDYTPLLTEEECKFILECLKEEPNKKIIKFTFSDKKSCEVKID